MSVVWVNAIDVDYAGPVYQESADYHGSDIPMLKCVLSSSVWSSWIPWCGSSHLPWTVVCLSAQHTHGCVILSPWSSKVLHTDYWYVCRFQRITRCVLFKSFFFVHADIRLILCSLQCVVFWGCASAWHYGTCRNRCGGSLDLWSLAFSALCALHSFTWCFTAQGRCQTSLLCL